MIKILVLGGTQFIGRDLVETLMINENYSLSLANREFLILTYLIIYAN